MSKLTKILEGVKSITPKDLVMYELAINDVKKYHDKWFTSICNMYVKWQSLVIESGLLVDALGYKIPSGDYKTAGRNLILIAGIEASKFAFDRAMNLANLTYDAVNSRMQNQ